ncbi:d-isomer specific 2-hydroxyacid dehydrogenase [Penicillium sp. IBT 35674x]|nr:d-isomer specific 2-hydroxyacid dehydrogenase [Penicillium sp. IBT 35674x]
MLHSAQQMEFILHKLPSGYLRHSWLFNTTASSFAYIPSILLTGFGIVPEYPENQKQAKWVDPMSDEDTEDAVGFGIMGYGCVGREVARVAKAFGMDVHTYTVHDRSTPESRKTDTFSEPGSGISRGISRPNGLQARVNSMTSWLPTWICWLSPCD